MATDPILERTRQADLQPLVANGVPVFRLFGQIRVELLRALSQDHLDLFADPNADPATGDIQWYAPLPGPKVRLADLPVAEKAAAERQLAQLVNDITTHVGHLQTAGTETARAMAQVLELALEIPEETHVFLVGGRPVLSGWGHVPRGPAAPRKLLTALVRRVAPPPPPPRQPATTPATPLNRTPAAGAALAPSLSPAATIAEPLSATGGTPRLFATIPVETPGAAKPRLGWLDPALWGLLTLLLLGIGTLLLRYCAIALPFSPAEGGVLVNACAAPVSADARRNRDLLAQLSEAERSADARRRAACTAAAQPPRAPAATGPDSTRQRQADAKATVGGMNVVLKWNTQDDLDLRVTCPDGALINFSTKKGCGGELDVDANLSDNQPSSRPVENVFWPKDAAPPGTYKVEVSAFKRRGTGPVDFTVELQFEGVMKEEHRQRFEQSQEKDKAVSVFEFTLPYKGPRP